MMCNYFLTSLKRSNRGVNLKVVELVMLGIYDISIINSYDCDENSDIEVVFVSSYSRVN